MKKTVSSKFSKSAFTIVELVIVIAVIGILAAITIVSYTSSRNQADKSALNATAQQVKLKIGEYYTDNNNYPLNKAAVNTYLIAVGANSLADEFNTSKYTYGAWTNPAKGSCTANVKTCQYYEITVNKSVWNGDASDTNIIVKP